MKRLIPILLLLCLVSAASAQNPPVVTTVQISDMPAVAVRHKNTLWKPIVSPDDGSASGNAACEIKAGQIAQPGDVIELGPVPFDFGDQAPIMLPKGVLLHGTRGFTIFKSSKQIDRDFPQPDGTYKIPFGPAWVLQDGTQVDGISFVDAPHNPGEDGGCLGFIGTNATAAVRNCDLQANDWSFYCWTPGNSVSLKNCKLTGGRVLLANEDSGNGSNVECEHCLFIGDASLSQSQGATSNPTNGGLFGIVHRGGVLKIRDCEMRLKGIKNVGTWATPPRIAAITDVGGGNDTPAGNTTLDIRGLRVVIDLNGADPSRCLDLDIATDYVRKNLTVDWSSCRGGHPSGGLRTSW
jgi:hypothetical protein